MHQFLRVYRCTPHTTTAFTPYYLLFGRELRTKFPEFSSSTHADDTIVRLRDSQAKRSMKMYSDQRTHAPNTSIEIGDVVVRQPKTNKMSTPYNPHPLVVADKKGSMITAKREGEPSITRNSSMFHHLPQISPTKSPELTSLDQSRTPANPQQSRVVNSPSTSERPNRTTNRPKRLIEEI